MNTTITGDARFADPRAPNQRLAEKDAGDSRFERSLLSVAHRSLADAAPSDSRSLTPAQLQDVRQLALLLGVDNSEVFSAREIEPVIGHLPADEFEATLHALQHRLVQIAEQYPELAADAGAIARELSREESLRAWVQLNIKALVGG